eukprot:2533083-Prymnesium_polylepis.1
MAPPRGPQVEFAPSARGARGPGGRHGRASSTVPAALRMAGATVVELTQELDGWCTPPLHCMYGCEQPAAL